MKRIKIIGGTYGYRPAGTMRLDTKNKNSEPFEVPDVEAMRLVAMGIAEIAATTGLSAESVATNLAQFVSNDGTTPDSDTATSGGGGPDGVGGSSPDENVDTEGDGADQQTPDNDGVPEYSVNNSAAELKDIMLDCGLSCKAGMTKSDMVKALDEFFSDAGDGEGPPELGAEGPVT